jgi:hypothetical protein
MVDKFYGHVDQGHRVVHQSTMDCLMGWVVRSPELGHMIGSGHGSSPRCAIHRKKDPKVAHKRQRMAVKRGRERR